MPFVPLPPPVTASAKKTEANPSVYGKALKSTGIGLLMAPVIFFVGFSVLCLTLFAMAKAVPIAGDIVMYPFNHTPSGRAQRIVQPSTQQAVKQQAHKPSRQQVAPKKRYGR